MNGFFGAAATLIEQQGGIVVNHVGDALIAAFNAPLPVEDYPARAVNAAREPQRKASGSSGACREDVDDPRVARAGPGRIRAITVGMKTEGTIIAERDAGV
jgi:class 3 adenylate cyclase